MEKFREGKKVPVLTVKKELAIEKQKEEDRERKEAERVEQREERQKAKETRLKKRKEEGQKMIAVRELLWEIKNVWYLIVEADNISQLHYQLDQSTLY